jgi:hypothetical protein
MEWTMDPTSLDVFQTLFETIFDLFVNEGLWGQDNLSIVEFDLQVITGRESDFIVNLFWNYHLSTGTDFYGGHAILGL